MVRNSTCFKVELIIIILIMSSCNRDSSKFGLDFNHERREIGIPVLPKGWKIQKKGTDFDGTNYIIWINPKNRTEGDSPIHFTKSIKCSEDKIFSETDTYHNGNKYQTIDGHSYVSLIFKYSYEQNIENGVNFSKGWSIHLYDKNGTTQLSLNQADSILRAWNLARNE